jgi:hyperosmotically inducible protein
MKHTLRLFLASAVMAGGWLATQAQDAPPKPDNSAVNKRDRAKDAVTAGSQKNDKADLDTAKKIREAIKADKTLSTYAHNIKVIALDGSVTLKGPVRTEEEKATVEAKAKEIAGADKVTSEISVVPKKSKSSKSQS